jgi:hypothetical protein
MPQDKTPLGDAMTHRFPDQNIPEPKPNAEERQRGAPEPDNDAELPDHAPPSRQKG